MKLAINDQHNLTNYSNGYSFVSDWYALRLLSNYRLFLLIATAALFYLPTNATVLGQNNVDLFHSTLITYLIIGIIFNHLIRIKYPNHDTQLYIQAYVDIICITLFTYASGGIQSGLETLLVANIAIIGVFTIARYTFLFAAIATLSIMAQEVHISFSSHYSGSSFVKTGFTGVALFVVAYITSVIIQKRVPQQLDKERLKENVERVEELNKKIIQQMDSGILVLDSQSRIQQANDSAVVLLGLKTIPNNTYLELLSKELNTAHKLWKSSPFSGTKAFKNSQNDLELLPHFSRLGDKRTLVSLEDYSLVSQQVQQLKLASLGRLSASIAHEIRNPLSAISNSVQLVQEDEKIGEQNQYLLNIAERHCQRINHIIEDILQLSKREKNNPELIDLTLYLPALCSQVNEQYASGGLRIDCSNNDPAKILFDRSHLQQILSSLCANAVTHNKNKKDLIVEIKSSYNLANNTVKILVSDNGKGIEKSDADEIFEPFYTSNQQGTGLGLFIVRELCEINNATIKMEPKPKGACFRLLIGAAGEYIS